MEEIGTAVENAAEAAGNDNIGGFVIIVGAMLLGVAVDEGIRAVTKIVKRNKSMKQFEAMEAESEETVTVNPVDETKDN